MVDGTYLATQGGITHEAHSKKSHCRVNVKTSSRLELCVDVNLFKATWTVLWSQRSADFYSRIYSSRLNWELQWPCMDTACGQIVLAQLFRDSTTMDYNDRRVVKGNWSTWNTCYNVRHQNNLLKDKNYVGLHARSFKIHQEIRGYVANIWIGL